MLSSPWSQTLDLLRRERLHDVLVVAVQDDGPAADALGDVYLQLDTGYLQFTSVGNHGGLRAVPVDRIDVQAYRDEFGLAAFPVRLGAFFLPDAQPVKVLQVNYVTNEESDPGLGIVRTAELVVEYGYRVALDPMYTTGVRVGNTDPWLPRGLRGPWTFHHHTAVFAGEPGNDQRRCVEG